ncbi:MAG TPA: hypothetical protein VNI01_09880 [Elusimicrobiota bacterium]|nr:hypothetical protein [Elusimicrobiota bacterium]
MRLRADLVAVALACLVAILLAAASAAAQRRAEAALAGVWTGSPNFLLSAGLTEFQLFVAPESAGRRAGYLIVADGSRLVANTAVQLRFVGRPGAALRAAFQGAAPYDGTLEFEADAELPFPSRLAARLGATLQLSDAGQVRADLRRDEAASEAALAAWEAARPI